MEVTRAPGTITVGVDKTGKHYKYEAGKGRGRQPLNLSPQVKATLEKAGLRHGNDLHIAGPIAAKLGLTGGGGGAKPTPQTGAQGAKPSIAPKIIESHKAWLSSPGVKGKSATKARLDLLLSHGREEWLASGNSPDHKAFAGVVLGTIFGVGLKDKRGTGTTSAGKMKVRFHPGGVDGGGHITLVSKDGKTNLARIVFKKVGDLTPEQIERARNFFTQGKLKPKVAKKPDAVKEKRQREAKEAKIKLQNKKTVAAYLKSKKKAKK